MNFERDNAEREESLVRSYFNEGWNWIKRIIGTGIFVMLLTAILALSCAVIFRITCVTFVDNYEYSYKFDKWNGKIERLGKIGYVGKKPILESIHTVDTRPMQVCISAIQRVLNCKLVQFDPNGIELFIKWHGRDDYSNEYGTRENPTLFNQILMAYAYEGSGKKYPFLTIIRELKAEEIEEIRQ